MCFSTVGLEQTFGKLGSLSWVMWTCPNCLLEPSMAASPMLPASEQYSRQQVDLRIIAPAASWGEILSSNLASFDLSWALLHFANSSQELRFLTVPSSLLSPSLWSNLTYTPPNLMCFLCPLNILSFLHLNFTTHHLHLPGTVLFSFKTQLRPHLSCAALWYL